MAEWLVGLRIVFESSELFIGILHLVIDKVRFFGNRLDVISDWRVLISFLLLLFELEI
jgi:hypothetical protein